MEPAINLYSSNEKSELIRENSQEILSVLAAHQIALWEYDIITGKCSFSNDYFFTLGLKDAGIIFEDMDDFYRLFIRKILNSINKPLQKCFHQTLRPHKLEFVV